MMMRIMMMMMRRIMMMMRRRRKNMEVPEARGNGVRTIGSERKVMRRRGGMGG